MKMTAQPDIVTVTENTLVEGTQKDPKFTASVNVAAAQASADNVDKLLTTIERNKEKMLKLKATLVKERGETIELNTKLQATLFEKDNLLAAYNNLNTEKEALIVQLMIMEGETNDFQAKLTDFETRASVANDKANELKTQVDKLLRDKESLMEPFWAQACKLQEQVSNCQKTLFQQIYNIKQFMARMQEIAASSIAMHQHLITTGNKLNKQLTWRENNPAFPPHLPQKTLATLKLDIALLEFCRKATNRLNAEIDKTLEKCTNFYEEIHQVHRKCQLPMAANIDELPPKDQQMAELQQVLQSNLDYIKKIDALTEEDIDFYVRQTSTHLIFLEDTCKAAPTEVANIET